VTSIEMPGKGCQGPGKIDIGEGTIDWQTLWEVLIHEDERPSWSLFILYEFANWGFKGRLKGGTSS